MRIIHRLQGGGGGQNIEYETVLSPIVSFGFYKPSTTQVYSSDTF